MRDLWTSAATVVGSAVLALADTADAETYETSTTPGYVDSDDIREALEATDG